MKKNIIILLLFTVIVSVNMHAENNKSFCFVRIENLLEQIVAEKIICEVFKKAEIPIEIESYPAKRANILASSGDRDGEIARIWSYGEVNPTLLRVPTAYSSLETAVFCKKSKNIIIKNKNDLKSYRIAVVRGVQHTYDITIGLKNIEIVDSIDQMMKMLEADRVDVVLTNTINGISCIKELKLNDIETNTILEILPLYVYVNAKNKDLIPVLDKMLVKMKKSGELSRLRSGFERELINSL